MYAIRRPDGLFWAGSCWSADPARAQLFRSKMDALSLAVHLQCRTEAVPVQSVYYDRARNYHQCRTCDRAADDCACLVAVES